MLHCVGYAAIVRYGRQAPARIRADHGADHVSESLQNIILGPDTLLVDDAVPWMLRRARRKEVLENARLCVAATKAVEKLQETSDELAKLPLVDVDYAYHFGYKLTLGFCRKFWCRSWPGMYESTSASTCCRNFESARHLPYRDCDCCHCSPAGIERWIS